MRTISLMFLFSLGVALAESQPPTPTPMKNTQNEKTHSSKPNNKSTKDQRGTEQSPLFVKVVPPTDTDSHTNKDAPKSNEKPPENRTIEILSIALTAFATIVIAVFTISLSCSTKRLWQEAKIAGRIALRSAQAANTSANAVMLAERAYVKMSHVPPGIEWIFKDAGLFRITVQIQNYGETPATVTDAFLEVKILPFSDSLPIEPIYEIGDRDQIPRGFLMPNDWFTHSINYSLQEETDSIKNMTSKMWIIGYVDYVDVFKKRHRNGYARVYNAFIDFNGTNNLILAVDRGYNYDRERKQNEGNDWDEEI